MTDLVLASASVARRRLLAAVGLSFRVDVPRVDEDAIREALAAEGASGTDVAGAIAETKAVKVSQRNPGALVLGGDQVLVCEGRIMAKAATPAEGQEQLRFLAGRTHSLLSAAVVARDGAPVWRHVGEARLTMHDLTDAEIDGYLARAWERVRGAVGLYHIEEDGARLFARVSGDPFVIQGIPLVELLTWLRLRGDITA